ncbi:centlein [Alosa sapidissima]|uniref:centlein n=1 Tax=Alosa sapidissima TaxID=34773 RepID=UPI001C096A60|nr:centlein [Alosa sapidissima]
MEEKDGNRRVFILEHEVKSLTEELSQCQADKEFVWSLWKRLQVANPDLTQAVSLIVEREREKAEAKDRKVLEILQAKDYKIQELEQKVTGQQQEINNLYQSRQRGDGELDIMKTELAALRQRQGNTSRELKEWRQRSAKAEEEGQRVVSALEEEKRGLEARCAALLADLERAREQQSQHSHRQDHIHTTVKELEQELASVKQQVCAAEARVCDLSVQLSSREQELTQKEQCVAQLRHELQGLQALYSQSVEHAGEQAQLIQQLEGLNLDTQRVLRSQEQAHTADTVSYHKLYTELCVTHRALVCNESQLREREAGLSTQLRERDQQLQQLQEQLQQLQVELQQQQQQQQQQQPAPLPVQQPRQSSSTTVCTQTRQTNSQHFEQLQLEPRLDAAEGEQDLHGALEVQGQTPLPQPQPGEPPEGPSHSECPGPKSRQSRGMQDHLLSSHHLLSSPLLPGLSYCPIKSSPGPCQGKMHWGGAPGPCPRGTAAEWLWRRRRRPRSRGCRSCSALKTEENEALRKAHDKRQERLRLIQTHYRSLREQLRQAEEAQGKSCVRNVRAEPWQLRQENSDGVWNELAFFRRQNKKLLAEKANLEEELDVLRVQAAMDRTTTHELRLCLEQEYQELLRRVATQETEVSSSTPSKPSARRLQESILRIEQLERKMESLEEETQQLHQDNQELQEANAALARARDDLQAALHRLCAQRAVQEEASQARAAAERERLLGEGQALQAEVEAFRREAEGADREASRARQRALRLRQELGVVRAERDFLRTTVTRRRAKGPVAPVSRIKVRSAWSRAPPGQHRARRRASPARDGWEDLSADSASEEEYSDSLDNAPPITTLRKKTIHRVYRCAGVGGRASLAELPAEEQSVAEPPSPRCCAGHEGRARKRRLRPKAACAETRPRVLALRQQIRTLQQDRREAEQQARQHSHACQQLRSQLQTTAQKLASSKQLAQKLSTELTGVEQQKKVLEMELEQWRRVQVQLPPPPAPPVQPAPAPDPSGPALKQLEVEVRQLQTKLKNASNEVTKHTAASKSLKAELGEKDQRLRELQEKLGHSERAVGMKKQLVEDLKTRLKFFQETERSLKGQLEELERKVKTLSEEASNRKAFVDSLKRRLSVATTEKGQHEASSLKLQEDLQKKDQKLQSLLARVAESEKAMAELQDAASRQMHGLTQQSTQALEGANRKLSLASAQLQQLHTFIQALAREVEREAQAVKGEVRKRKRQRKASIQGDGRLSKSSMVRAQSIAASILNMSERDLVDMLDTDEEAEDGSGEQDWLQSMHKLLQHQIPSAELLMDAMLAKMKERKVLTEELATLEAAVSEKA